MGEMYLAGFTQKEIADLWGVSRCCLKRILRDLRIPLRTDRPRLYAVDETFFDKIDTEEKAYWLGFITADGCVDNRGFAFSITIQKSDRDHLKKFKKIIESQHPIRTIENTSILSIGSQKLVRALIRLGVTPCKSYTVHPCKDIPIGLTRYYWRGLLDGDGSITIRPSMIQIGYTGSKFMVDGFKDFVRTFAQSLSSPHPSKGVFAIGYGGSGLPKRIVEELYDNNTVSLTRKNKLARQVVLYPVQRHRMKFGGG